MSEDTSVGETRLLLSHILGLVRPGKKTLAISVHTHQPGDLTGWNDNDYQLLIDQARFQLSRQRQDLENVRSRAQILFSTALGALGLTGLVLPSAAANLGWFILWLASAVAILLSVLGAASVVAARKDLGEVETVLLSQQHPPILKVTATAFAHSIATGENTLATELTVFRSSVLPLVGGLIVLGLTYFLAN